MSPRKVDRRVAERRIDWPSLRLWAIEGVRLVLVACLSSFLAVWAGRPASAPDGPLPKISEPDPHAAIVRLAFGGVGCSATIIGPRREDGRWNVLTAAHCAKSVGQKGQIQFRDGRTCGVAVAAINRKCDACWMITDCVNAEYPYALLVNSMPAVGTPIWHHGYGVDKPGNVEEGEILGGANGDGQIKMMLSVSSGDSGGGIACTADGRVVSCVCCTAAKGRRAAVYGASPECIEKLLLEGSSGFEWTPIEVPIRGDG